MWGTFRTEKIWPHRERYTELKVYIYLISVLLALPKNKDENYAFIFPYNLIYLYSL